MKMLAYTVLGLIALAGVAFAAFWIWGTLAFTPERMPVVLEAQGDLGGGARYQIERTSRGLITVQRVVHVSVAEGAPVTALYVEGDRPRPVSVRRLDGAIEVAFASGVAPVRVALTPEGWPTEYVAFSRSGEVTRAPQAAPAEPL